jgi:hypothetical protein
MFACLLSFLNELDTVRNYYKYVQVEYCTCTVLLLRRVEHAMIGIIQILALYIRTMHVQVPTLQRESKTTANFFLKKSPFTTGTVQVQYVLRYIHVLVLQQQVNCSMLIIVLLYL